VKVHQEWLFRPQPVVNVLTDSRQWTKQRNAQMRRSPPRQSAEAYLTLDWQRILKHVPPHAGGCVRLEMAQQEGAVDEVVTDESDPERGNRDQESEQPGYPR
jgi:hypothetical protein